MMNRLVEALNKKTDDKKCSCDAEIATRRVKIKSLYRRNRPEAKKDKYPFKSYYAKPISDDTIPVIRKSDSSSSIDKIEKELSYFVKMEKKRGVFSIFRRSKSTSSASKKTDATENKKYISTPQPIKKITKEDEAKYARNHIQEFNKIKDRFENEPLENHNDIKRDSKTLILQDIRDNLERTVETQREIRHSSNRPQKSFDTADNAVQIRKPQRAHSNRPQQSTAPIKPNKENSPSLVSSPKIKLPPNRVIETLRPRTPTKNTNRIVNFEDAQQRKVVSRSRSLKPEKLVFNYDESAVNRLEYSPMQYTPNSPANKSLMKKSVEAYYWRELRKMQEEELNRELEYNQRIHGYLASQRANSLSPVSQRHNNNSRQYYQEDIYQPIYEDLPQSKPIVRRSSLMEVPTQYQYNRQVNNPRYMLVPIKSNDPYYSDDEYARPYVQQRPRIRHPLPQNAQYNPQGSTRGSYAPLISVASTSGSIYDYPGTTQPHQRYSYAPQPNKSTIQYHQNAIYGTIQPDHQFVRNTRFTSSMGNIQNHPRTPQNHAVYGRLV